MARSNETTTDLEAPITNEARSAALALTRHQARLLDRMGTPRVVLAGDEDHPDEARAMRPARECEQLHALGLLRAERAVGGLGEPATRYLWSTLGYQTLRAYRELGR